MGIYYDYGYLERRIILLFLIIRLLFFLIYLLVYFIFDDSPHRTFGDMYPPSGTLSCDGDSASRCVPNVFYHGSTR